MVIDVVKVIIKVAQEWSLRSLNRVIAFAVTLVLCCFVGCGGGVSLNSFVADVDPRGWYRATTISIPNSDTISLRDISIFVRHQPIERVDTLSLTLRTVTPSGYSVDETVTIPFEDVWHKRRNETKITEIVYRTDVRWREQGVYKMLVTPRTPTRGIEAIGAKFTDKIDRKR